MKLSLALLFTSSLITATSSHPQNPMAMTMIKSNKDADPVLVKRARKQRWDGCRLTVSVLAPNDLTMEFAQKFGADPENVRTPEMARSVQVMKDAIAVGDQKRAHDALYTNCQASVRDDAIKHNTGP
ncbi:hypothetical protein GQ602_004587 [Ophiocordyceps camponoti-floridani]|uniref:Uncharacterized protein n=1 Tax=Ophiocordyceps camponoti-floridani TaxID=2030778 RepID=A0A8H4Q703_9HYPO|nr:hypothetical protein GQ602_004587 [Ophiocordyceps camponoti-floridani]